MGGSKRLMEEIEARGASFGGDRYVCAFCLEDSALKAFVRENVSRYRCDYCGRRRPSVKADEVVELIVEGLRTEYEDPNNVMGWDSGEGGWLGVTTDKGDLVRNFEVTENEELYEDIVDVITLDEWCEQDPYGLSTHERLSYGWERFCELVKYENRFFPTMRRKRERYPDPDEVPPAELLRSLADILPELGLIRHVPIGTRVIRARTHNPGVVLGTATELGSPPKEQAYMANRMSSPGIPMFYGSFNRKTALAEVDYPASRKAATVATFETVTPFRVVDLSRLPQVPSLFDLDRNYLRRWIPFIHDFVADISKPIARDDRVHVEYAPTQYVTAWIQNRMPGRIKGIIYPSSKVLRGTSCVLFFRNEECREDGEGYPKPKQYLKLLPRSIRRFPARS